MLADLGYYITATKITEDDILIYVWTGNGFELTDHIQQWPKWQSELKARKQFDLALETAKALDFSDCGLYFYDTTGDDIIKEVDLIQEN